MQVKMSADIQRFSLPAVASSMGEEMRSSEEEEVDKLVNAVPI